DPRVAALCLAHRPAEHLHAVEALRRRQVHRLLEAQIRYDRTHESQLDHFHASLTLTQTPVLLLSRIASHRSSSRSPSLKVGYLGAGSLPPARTAAITCLNICLDVSGNPSL